jgi:hypothetical protein
LNERQKGARVRFTPFSGKCASLVKPHTRIQRRRNARTILPYKSGTYATSQRARHATTKRTSRALE